MKYYVTVRRITNEELEEVAIVEADSEEEAEQQAIIDLEEAANNGLAFIHEGPVDYTYEIVKPTYKG